VAERPQQNSQTLAVPTEIDVRFLWWVCLLEIGHLMRGQRFPKILRSQPGENFIPLRPERRTDDGE